MKAAGRADGGKRSCQCGHLCHMNLFHVEDVERLGV